LNKEEREQQAIGRYMIIGMWVVGLVLATLLLHNWLERQRNPNNSVVTSLAGDKRQITLQRGRHGHYLLTGKINGVNVDFLIDTGATTVSIPADFAERIGLRRGTPVTISTANGLSTAYQTRIDSLQMGELEIQNASAHINPGLTSEVLLGMSVLQHYELVQRGETLIIREP